MIGALPAVKDISFFVIMATILANRLGSCRNIGARQRLSLAIRFIKKT
jgi:hypothetical protein